MTENRFKARQQKRAVEEESSSGTGKGWNYICIWKKSWKSENGFLSSSI